MTALCVEYVRLEIIFKKCNKTWHQAENKSVRPRPVETGLDLTRKQRKIDLPTQQTGKGRNSPDNPADQRGHLA